MSVNILGKYNTVTAQCYAGSSHSTCKMITIIVSVLDEIRGWFACFTQIHTSSLAKEQTLLK